MRWTVAAAVLLALIGHPARAGEAVTEKQLTKMIEKGIDLGVVLRLVERDCVAFEVDAAAVLRLSETLPASVLQAAMDCREDAGRTPPVPASPPPTPVEAPAPVPVAPAPPAPVPVAPAPPTAPDPPLSLGAPLSLDQVERISIVAIAQDGKLHKPLTSVFQKMLAKQDRFELSSTVDLVHSGSPLDSVLAAGREAGAQAVLLGIASTYSLRGYPSLALRLEARLVEVQGGQVLWTSAKDSADTGTHHSWHEVRQAVAKAVLKELP